MGEVGPMPANASRRTAIAVADADGDAQGRLHRGRQPRLPPRIAKGISEQHADGAIAGLSDFFVPWTVRRTRRAGRLKARKCNAKIAPSSSGKPESLQIEIGEAVRTSSGR